MLKLEEREVTLVGRSGETFKVSATLTMQVAPYSAASSTVGQARVIAKASRLRWQLGCCSG